MKNSTRRKKLAVGIVCYPSVGGSGIVATQLGTELARLGHKVHFMSYEEPFKLDTREKNIFFHKVSFLDYPLFKYPDYTRPLAVMMVNVAKKYKLDILHVHYAVPHGTAALLAKSIAESQGIRFPKIITTLHGTDITLLGRDGTVMPVIKYSTEHSDGVTAVSESLKRDTIKVLKTKKDIRVIHNFYAVKTPKKSPAAVRKDLGVSAEDFLVVHLSNLRPVKRIPDLLEVMSKLKMEKHIKLLVLAGGDWKQYLPLVKKLGIEKQVIVRERVRDIENYISASDIGLYTSEEESFGMGILETMAYGKPVLATRIGGIPEFMEDGKSGYLFKLSDTASFADKLSSLAHDPELVAKLGAHAFETAQKLYTPEKKVQEYLDYYAEIMKPGI